MSILKSQAEALGVSRATVSNYRRALRSIGKRVTVSTLRAHGKRQKPGPKPNNERTNRIRDMRDNKRMTWAAIGRRFRISASRACALYNHS